MLVELSNEQRALSIGSIPPPVEIDMRVDRVAVALCLYTKALIAICMLTFSTIASPYCMTAFGWTSAQTVLYISIILGLVGLNFILWNGIYVIFDLRKR